ncbi:ABC transporter ATP-binding protein [Bradyrhizobium sp. SSUT18]|uniref:ABC transporter ATP-binding protein n=1 Tax=Bradyrhizobium sp. SSUT18 TaxID=3040602 RepID=UPI0024485A4B|nr:ABC transporter ATP-binding protein [Bradyrhizobium sp. SSUT18]MDH2398384.1 ABC transporter ATP-binding protein [Bradyrhizobium sp. SSUT18]
MKSDAPCCRLPVGRFEALSRPPGQTDRDYLFNRGALDVRDNMEQPRNLTSASMQSLPIGIADISKVYGAVAALKNVSLDIRSGEFMTLLGPSGSGKTTLLMVLAGFIRPDHGSLKFGAEEVILKPPHQRGVGMMFQNYALFPHMNVFANIAYPLKVRKWSKREIDEAVAQVLETVQLPGYENRRISELSGGQKQRIALARAVVAKPKILLMDEPLSALDKNLRERMQVELRAMHERLGMTTVLVTHDQREALTMSDRIAVMRAGEIAQIDAAEDLYNAPKTAFIAEFMGESNFLPTKTSGGQSLYRDQTLKLAYGSTPPEGEGLLVIRPEKMEVITPSVDPSAFNVFDGILERILFQGESCLAFVLLPTGETISVRRNLREGTKSLFPQRGEPISVGLHINESRVVGRDIKR